MPALGANARFSAPGDRNTHASFEDPLENRGYALWQAVQGKVKNSGVRKDGPVERGLAGVEGFEIEVNLKRKVGDLWPVFHHQPKMSQETYVRELYSFLRVSGNMVCVKQPGVGEHGIPTWWVRREWNDVKAVGVFRPVELTPREKRLSRAEAGEDRPAAPVTVKQREVAAAEADAVEKSLEQQQVDTYHERQAVEDTLKHALVPMHQIELADALKITNLRVGRHLRQMIEAGTIFRRLESGDERAEGVNGRKRYLYWREADVPFRSPEERMPSNPAIDRINSLKPGESLSISWMSPGHLREIDELVAVGILERYEDKGPRIRLAEGQTDAVTEETVPTPQAAAPVPAPKPAPAPVPTPAVMPAKTEVRPAPEPAQGEERGIDEIARYLEQFVRQETRRRSDGKAEELQQLKVKLVSERALTDKAAERADKAEARVRELESLLIEARTELSAERDRMRKARELFGA